MKRTIFMIFLLLPMTLFAEDPLEIKAGAGLKYYFPHHNGYGYEGNSSIPVEYGEQEPPAILPYSRSLGSGAGKLDFAVFTNARYRLPLPLAESGMFSGGYLDFTGELQLSPASVSLAPAMEWQPLPFIKLGAGCSFGTGWYVETFDANGLGLNENADGDADRNRGGLVLEPYLSLLFQVDTAAIWPGDWNHVVFQAKGKLLFPWYSLADEGEAWVWKNDIGENINGTVLETTWTIGYLMPALPFRLAAFRWETEGRLGPERDDAILADGDWGSDFDKHRFGLLFLYRITEEHQLILQVQWATERHYRGDTVFAAHFRDRESTGDTYVYFDGITLAYTYTIY